jgi:O-antigen/teichoic acid export membrane protein
VILRNFLSLAFGRFTALAIGALVTFVLARALGVESYGEFIAALASAELFAAFLDLGLSRILVKEGSVDRKRVGGHLANILLIKSLLSAAVLLLVHLLALRMGWMSPLYQLTMLLMLCKVADSFGIMFDGVFQVFQRMEYSAIILVTGRVFLLISVLAGWVSGRGILYFGWLYFLISALTAMATVLIASRRFASPKSGMISLRETVGREGIFFAISSILYMVNSRVDMLVLREWASPEALGLYASAIRLALVFQILPMVLQAAVLPVLFDYGRNQRERLPGFYRDYLRRSLLLSLFPLLLLGLFPQELIGTLFGENYLPAAGWLKWLALLLPLRFLSLAPGNLLTALDRQRERTLCVSSGVALTLFLMFWRVPAGGVGSVIVALISGEALMAALCLLAAFRQGYGVDLKMLARVLVALAVSALLLSGVQRILDPGFLGAIFLLPLLVIPSILLSRAASLQELREIVRRPTP